jgi:hypothetical protein
MFQTNLIGDEKWQSEKRNINNNISSNVSGIRNNSLGSYEYRVK